VTNMVKFVFFSDALSSDLLAVQLVEV